MRHLNYANVTATLALVFAMSGAGMAEASQQLSLGRAARVTRTAARLVRDEQEATFSVYPAASECVRLARTLVECPFEYGSENEHEEVTEICRDSAVVRLQGNGQIIYRTLSSPSCKGGAS